MTGYSSLWGEKPPGYRIGFLILMIALCVSDTWGASNWDVRITSLATFVSAPAAGGGMYLGDSNGIFAQGESININCQWKYDKTGSQATRPNWTLSLLVNGVMLSSKQVAPYPQLSTDNFGGLVASYTSHTVATHKVECRASHVDQTPQNNTALIELKVVPKTPGVGGTFPVPAPSFLSPLANQKIIGKVMVKLPVVVEIPDIKFGGVKSFVEYAKQMHATPYKVLCHFDLVSTGKGKLGAFESTIAQQDVEISGQQCGYDFVLKNKGHYAVRAYFKQLRDSEKYPLPVTGPNSRIEFTVIENLKPVGGESSNEVAISPTVPLVSSGQGFIKDQQTATVMGKPFLQELSDLSLGPRVRIHGGALSVTQNAGTALGLAQAESRNYGKCNFKFDYVIKNIGYKASDPFSIQWRDEYSAQIAAQNLGPLQPGSSVTPSDVIPLSPGKHHMELKVDFHHEVNELKESNNNFTFTVIVDKECKKMVSNLPVSPQNVKMQGGATIARPVRGLQGRPSIEPAAKEPRRQTQKKNAIVPDLKLPSGADQQQ